MLSAIRTNQREAPSACVDWTVRDVVGHAISGHRQLGAWAAGTDYAERAGAPGAPHPAVLAGPAPVAVWRAAREASVAALTEETTRLDDFDPRTRRDPAQAHRHPPGHRPRRAHMGHRLRARHGCPAGADRSPRDASIPAPRRDLPWDRGGALRTGR
ncbi:hypothetical protein [Amycolatopsis sp. NPDC049868]|uniref:hypothetical protein n=1 Tax=Amycolatopsis sp. NPDC049868 TaxID=3363934 RepID=UPI0037A07903